MKLLVLTSEPITAEQLREFIHRLKPLTIAGLVTAYEQAIDESAAESADRRTTTRG